MFKILRDLLRYNREFLIGFTLTLAVFVFAALHFLARPLERMTERLRSWHPDWPEDELLVTGRAERQMDLEYLAYGDFKPITRWNELFEKLTVPTLVLSGDDLAEVCITEDVERGIAEIANPAVRVVRIPGSAHCIRREQPDGYYAAVDAFLAEHLPG